MAFAKLTWHFYIFYTSWLAFEVCPITLVLYRYCQLTEKQLFFVARYVIETKGRTLEETAALFDGEQPSLELQMIGNDAATHTLNEIQANSLRARLEARLEANHSAVKLDSVTLGRTESSTSTTVL